MRKKAKSIVEHATVEVEGRRVPAKIYREMRASVRFSITRKSAILRMPLLLAPAEAERQVERFRGWVQGQLAGKEALQARFFGKTWQDGDTLTVGARTYRLQVEPTDAKTHTARLQGGVIRLLLTRSDTDAHRQKATRHLLSRIVAQDFQPAVERRVAELNRQHFQKPVASVNLKYNLSNWGSCSTRGNVNLSTRLLFAPGDVVDYVIIHELAHLVEMNHSDRFWRVVERAMPDYRQKETWLKKNWSLCDF